MHLRKLAVAVAGLILVTGASRVLVAAPQSGSQASSQNQSTAQNQSSSSQNNQQSQQESVADAARKARAQAKTAPANAKTFTNDDIANLRTGGVSQVGAAPQASTLSQAAANSAGEKPATGEVKDEAYWRKRFSEARAKLALAQKELDISQRELNTLQTQYYADPNVALQQQYSRDDINAKTAKIDAKKQEVAQLQQALDDLTEELRRSGAPAGWGN